MRTTSRFRRLRTAISLIVLRELSIVAQRCPLCRFPLIIRLRNEELGVRCIRCGASAVTMSLVSVLSELPISIGESHVYELSSAGPLVGYLKRRAAAVTTSEYFDDVVPGTYLNGVQCQDVQSLTYRSEMFDVCTSSEVFEHVEDDFAGFTEILRVLKPGGYFVFSVPLSATSTLERTEIIEGQRIRILPPEYHSDRIRGNRVFVYRDYGWDIVNRLSSAGFESADIRRPTDKFLGYSRPIVIAKKPLS
jgi:SAM-dependent methyltransferase